jgi:hypothetical protein
MNNIMRFESNNINRRISVPSEDIHTGNSDEDISTVQISGAEESNYFDESKLSEYTNTNERVRQEISEINTTISEIFGNSDADLEYITPDSVVQMLQRRESLAEQNVEIAANYPGDWTELLQSRMLDEKTKQKFIEQRKLAIPTMREGAPGVLDKPNSFASHYEGQIADYEGRVNKIFSVTNIGTAAEHGKRPNHLGIGNINDPGTVFLDAELKTGTKLSIRQKNIIEAHEKGHGLRDFTSPRDVAEIRSVIDQEALRDLQQLQESAQNPDTRFPINYVQMPEEIIERMAQLKNYFGMSADEEFTAQHLEYARGHYITDTGLDNGISTFLNCVTDKTKGAFLSIMNKYPI